MKPKHLQLIENERGDTSGQMLISSPIRITKVSDAKRLLSKLIFEFQMGRLKNSDAKDLCYLLISYVNICSQVDFEKRLNHLEEKIGNENPEVIPYKEA